MQPPFWDDKEATHMPRSGITGVQSACLKELVVAEIKLNLIQIGVVPAIARKTADLTLEEADQVEKSARQRFPSGSDLRDADRPIIKRTLHGGEVEEFIDQFSLVNGLHLPKCVTPNGRLRRSVAEHEEIGACRVKDVNRAIL